MTDTDDTDQDTTLDSQRFVDGADAEGVAPASDETPRNEDSTVDDDHSGPVPHREGTTAAGSTDAEPETSSSMFDDVVLDDVAGENDDEASPGLFDDLLSGDPIFESKEVLRPSYKIGRASCRERV